MVANQPVTTPVPAVRAGQSRALMLAAAICMLLAAFVAGGADILTTNAWCWGFGGLCAWALSYVVGYWGLW